MIQKFSLKKVTIFLLFSVFSNLSFATPINNTDSTTNYSGCSIGLNFYSLVHLPYLSIDYKVNKKFAISLEAKPRIIPYKQSRGYSSDSFFSRRVWENFNLKGVQGGLILHRLAKDTKKWNFCPAIEYAYSYKYGRYFYIDITDGNNGVDIARHTSGAYYEFFSRSTHSLNALVFYGKEKFKIYLGVGIAYNTERERGYSYWKITTYEGSEDSIYPLVKKSSYYSPVFKFGLKFPIFSFPNKNIKK